MNRLLDAEGSRNPRKMFPWLAEFGAEFLNSTSSDSEKSFFLNSVETNARSLALQDPEAAVTALETLPAGRYRDHVTRGAIEAIAGFDVEEATRLAGTLSGDRRTDAEVAIVRAHLRREGIDGVMPLIEAIDDPARQREILRRSVIVYEGADRKQQAALIDRFFVGDPESMNYVPQFVNYWGAEDPGAAGQWLEHLHNEDEYQESVEYLVNAWKRHDLAGASEYVSELNHGPARDAAAVKLIEEVLETDPRSAVEWSASLADPKLRRRHLDRALLEFDKYANRPDEAVELLEALPIDSDERQEVIQALGR
jgi:hypothetical protein